MIAFENIPHHLLETGKKLAEARAQWEFLDEMRKVVLAGEMNLHLTSEAGRDRIARSSDVYIKHLEAVKIARQTMLEHTTEYEALQARFEWYRTQNANSRAEISIR